MVVPRTIPHRRLPCATSPKLDIRSAITESSSSVGRSFTVTFVIDESTSVKLTFHPFMLRNNCLSLSLDSVFLSVMRHDFLVICIVPMLEILVCSFNVSNISNSVILPVCNSGSCRVLGRLRSDILLRHLVNGEVFTILEVHSSVTSYFQRTATRNHLFTTLQ